MSIIAIVAMLAGYFTFFGQVKPSSALALDIDTITWSDSRPSATSVTFQNAVSTSNDIGATGCAAQPCAAITWTFPTDQAGAATFGVATATQGDVSFAGGVTYTFNSVVLSNTYATGGAMDTITLYVDVATNTQVFAKANTATITYGGGNIVLPSATGTYAIATTLSVDDGNGWETVGQASTNMLVAEEQTISATVNEALSLQVAGITATTVVGSLTTTDTGTATTCPFGVIAPYEVNICGQTLTVVSNLAGGWNLYTVADANMTSGNGDEIQQFQDGVRIDESVAITWTSPSDDQGDPLTWGHLGVSSDDNVVYTNGNNYLAGIPNLVANTPSTDGLLATGATATTGQDVNVTYMLESGTNLPPGTYTTNLAYIVVPQF